MSGPSPRGGWLRSSLGAASLALVVTAALTVPMPYIEYLPGGATPIAPLVAIDGAQSTALDGETALLTVRLTRQPLAQLLLVALDDERTVIPTARVYPSGVDRQVHLERERERFNRQFDVAAAVGAQAAGFPFEVVTEVVVIEVLVGGPSDGRLAPGDIVLAVDGEPLTSGAALAERIESAEPGDQVVVRVQHMGAERDETITLRALEDGGPARLGVLVQTAIDELVLPIDIVLTPGLRIGGPSAGLMVGLTVFDLLAQENLLAGRRVAGTGTLDIDGRVGEVGGVREKTIGAIDAGYDVLLVPASSAAEAQRVADGRIVVHGVASLDEALAALRR
jgi:PDZ domain-containing protein